MKEISIDISKAVVYNKALSNSEGGCFSYVKASNGKTFKMSYDCAKSKEAAQYWDGGQIMWDMVDLIRSNPAIIAMEEVNADEQMYVDGLGGPDAAPKDNEDRFLNQQMGKALPTHEYPAFKKDDSQFKNSNKSGKVWEPLSWVKEFPGYAPEEKSVAKPIKREELLKNFSQKQKEQTQDPHKQQGKMPVPALGEPIQHYDTDLNHYGDKQFYQQQYPGLGPNSVATAEEITHYDGLYQHDTQIDPVKPKKLGKKFKYNLSKRSEYNNQYKVLIEAPMKLYKNFMVAGKGNLAKCSKCGCLNDITNLPEVHMGAVACEKCGNPVTQATLLERSPR